MGLIVSESVGRDYGTGSGKSTALASVSLAINEGESIAIVGRSGSGKSTLLHLLAALDVPTRGKVLFDGMDVNELSERGRDRLRNRDFGFVFQHFHLDERSTVAQNVELPLTISGVRSSERRAKVAQVLDQLGLADRGKSRVSTLSGGQRQRVAIARALVNSPRIIFADEPTGALDSENGERVADILFDLNRREDLTLVMVTHSEDLAARCLRTIRIADGRLIEDAAAVREGKR